ncbi:MAG: aminopeptidase [Desulfuromonadales bacterium]|nr:aminopeptidase [Desulfuromonadales bacterium]
MRRLLYILVFVLSLLLLSACSESQYLAQCVKGHLSVMASAEPIEDILAQENESQDVRDQLTKVVRMREFAVNSLHLPDSGSYRTYVDLERPYVVWNLVAAPEFSLKLNQWCFPIAGCVTYRGYFDQVPAKEMAKSLSAQGFDVDVYGVQAYSTLNWFDDPVLNTFLTNDDIRLAALLFHEMSHKVIYVQNDTAFNESFAKTVEMEGLRRWLEETGSSDLWQQCLQREGQSADFNKFLGTIRDELRQLYASELDNDQKRLAKQDVITHAFEKYEHLKQGWAGYDGYDQWMSGGLNNARLSSMATYYELVPAFQMLLRQVDYDLNKFYAKVKDLGSLPKDERIVKLKSLSPSFKAALD